MIFTVAERSPEAAFDPIGFSCKTRWAVSIRLLAVRFLFLVLSGQFSVVSVGSVLNIYSDGLRHCIDHCGAQIKILAQMTLLNAGVS